MFLKKILNLNRINALNYMNKRKNKLLFFPLPFAAIIVLKYGPKC